MPRSCCFTLWLAVAVVAGCRSVHHPSPAPAAAPSPVVGSEAPAAEAPREHRPRALPAPVAAPEPLAPAPSPVTAPRPVEVVALRAGVWLHTSWDEQTGLPANGLIVREPQRVVLVDVPASAVATLELLQWAETELQQPIARVIITHAEANRAAGARVLEAHHIPLVALANTTAQLAMLGGPRANSLGELAPGGSIRIGTIELFYPGLSHRADATAVWLKDVRLLYGGCAVTAVGGVAPASLTPAERQSWATAIRRVLQRFPEATLVVPAQGRPGGQDLLHFTLRLLAAAA